MWLKSASLALLFSFDSPRPRAQTPAPAPLESLYADSLLLNARAALEAHKLDLAEEDARQELARKPDSAAAMYFLARLLQTRNVPRDSLSWFTRAAKLATPSGEDLRIVALDYVLLNDTADALHWLTRSVALDANNSEAWYDLGRVHMSQSNFAAALEPMQRALALDPHMVKAENNLGSSSRRKTNPCKPHRLTGMRCNGREANPAPVNSRC